MARKKVRRRTVEFAVTAGNADRFSGTIQRTLTYTPNTKILCKDWNGLYYDAKVLRVEELPDASLVYVIHYMVKSFSTVFYHFIFVLPV